MNQLALDRPPLAGVITDDKGHAGVAITVGIHDTRIIDISW